MTDSSCRNEILGISSWSSVFLLVVALILTPASVSYSVRVNSYREALASFENIRLAPGTNYNQTLVRVTALMEYSYFNAEFSERFGFTLQQTFATVTEYQNYQPSITKIIYYHKDEPGNIIFSRDLNDNEKTLIAVCVVAWILGLCLGTIAIFSWITS